ncbi:MAG: DNA mismatch repair endonuclease MutL [Flavobacteriaceae bacterium]|nr:DNA mismatch repair endonuclease MutL [Flavobacteriaceae bacterium]
MADRISLLPEHVANQIAAGEVIQRPASVVKELLENAVDAKADSIQLIIKDAGKTLIQVIDNGIGMSTTDIRMAFERHATSKIKAAEDLFNLNTKGFRGEALASIAAVAQIETHSRPEDEELAHLLKIEGSEVKEQTLTTNPKGTSIAVKNLFYNIPARRNFLKSNTVELRHIIDEFHRVALAHPEIAIAFFQNGDDLFNLQKASLRKRIVGIFGGKWDTFLVPVEEHTSLARLEGFVLKPSFSKKTRGQQFFFVNRRFIKSPFLHHAVLAAYEGLLQRDHHPGYILFLDVAPETLDINIHPNKTEIKFEDEQSLYAILRSAIKHSLGIFQVQPLIDFDNSTNLDVPYDYKDKTAVQPNLEIDASFNPFQEKGLQRDVKKSAQWEALFSHPETLESNPPVEGLDLEMPRTPKVFQLFSKYIVCALPSGLLLIDQSRAHQRVLYEQFLGVITKDRAASQQLLFPVAITLDTTQKAYFKEVEDILVHIGFQWNPIQNSLLEITAAPDLVSQDQVEKIIEEVLFFEHEGKKDANSSMADKLAKKMAKALAIKAGITLEIKAQQELIDNLFGCKETLVSPFNKRIFITLEKAEIEQKML